MIDGIWGLVITSGQVVGEQRDGRKEVRLLVVGSSIGRREVLVVVQEGTVLVTVVVVRRHEMGVGKMIRHGHGRTGLEFGMTLEDRTVSHHPRYIYIYIYIRHKIQNINKIRLTSPCPNKFTCRGFFWSFALVPNSVD